jgi:uncharacterized protein with gpF-like domain
MLKSPDGKRKLLSPVRPNISVQMAYQKRLDALIDEMARSVLWWIKAAYRATPPLAVDEATPAVKLNQEMNKLSRRWQDHFDSVARDVAKQFATRALGQADASFTSSFRKAGMTVKWHFTPAMRDAYTAVVNENVALIKSIPAEYLTQIQGHVMRSVAAGRDMGYLAKVLKEQFGVTKRRAALIARDQNEKATAVVVKTRQQEAGITQAIWRHSAAGRHPRPGHVKAGRDNLVYNVAEGAFIDGEWIWPGELINCRCFSRSIIPGVK